MLCIALLSGLLPLIAHQVHIPFMHYDAPRPCWSQIMLLYLQRERQRHITSLPLVRVVHEGICRISDQRIVALALLLQMPVPETSAPTMHATENANAFATNACAAACIVAAR